MKTAPAGGMSFEGPEFEKDITELIYNIRPKKIIETGTYLGLGSTLILAKALKNIPDSELLTIEVNPDFYKSAVKNLQGFPNVQVLNGLSIPIDLLPTKEELIKWLDGLEKEDIFVDFAPQERIELYMNHCRHHLVADDFLRKCIIYFGYKPELILLDSSGHLGFIEFQYILTLLMGSCYFILDDVFHVKHYDTLKYMQKSPKFQVEKLSREKFGYCIAKYNIFGGTNHV
jgi:hypothetical protein